MTIVKQIVLQETEINKKLICDKCGKSIDFADNIWDDSQEWFHYKFTGGYGSIFGDLCTYEIDLCQECMNECFGKYLRLIKEE